MIQLLDTNAVKLPISNHPKYKDLVIAYRRCLIMGIDKQDVSSIMHQLVAYKKLKTMEK